MQEVEREESQPDSEPGIFSEPSILDVIKEDAKKIAESEEVYIAIAGYENSGLTAKYHLPESGKQLDAINTKINREFKDRFTRNLYMAIDTMILLCDGLYVKPPWKNDDEFYELDPDMSGEPVRYDVRLAEALNFGDITRARNIVRRVFGENDMAIMNHAEKLARWLSNTRADVSRDIWDQLGE